LKKYWRIDRDSSTFLGFLSDIQKQYDAAIAATRDPAAQKVLEKQKKDVNFAERVLRLVSPPDRNNPPETKPHSDKSDDEPYQIGELP
jgi:hypothetical protein